jgi:hypothetical protein
MSKFNDKWSRSHQYDPNKHEPSILNSWDCKDKAGIYVIRDEFDASTLYVGKAEGTSCDIHTRLTKHLSDRGNAGIGDLVKHQQKLTIRWAECDRPELAESIAITQLEPLFNKRAEWAGIDRVSVDDCMQEAERLGLITSKDEALDRICKAVTEQISTLSTSLDKSLSQTERSFIPDKNSRFYKF